MKTFIDYLTESKKIYEFKIGIAGDVPEDIEARMESALKKYGVSKVSKGKKTPIQERPLDFPRLKNIDVRYYEVELTYPTTSQVLQEYLGSCCEIEKSHIIVRTPGEPLERYQEDKTEETYETILTTEDLGGDSAQKDVGGNRVMELLKELEKARKERDHDPMEGAPQGESKDIDNKENAKSVIGG